MKYECFYVKNNVFREVDNNITDIEANPVKSWSNDAQLFDLLRNKKDDITEKVQGHISSFNFNKKVFNSGIWNELSTVARGLFFNNITKKIVARGFPKFFNLEERTFNSRSWLKEHLAFPVYAYKKYNGFLGILSFDETDKKFMFCTKSMIGGTYSEWFKDIFYNAHNDEGSAYYTNLAKYLVENNVCLVFEVIDPVNDPHIVKYDNRQLILLDEIKLEPKFKHASYEDLITTALMFGFMVKEKSYTFSNWDELNEFIEKMKSYSMTAGEEGYVIEDQECYHFKLKGEWYHFWKEMRGVKMKLAAGHLVSTSKFITPFSNDVYGFMTRLGREKLQNMSIIDVREAFKKEL